MTLDKLKPGMIVYSVERRKRGNTAMSIIRVYRVKIISVDNDHRIVTASWNWNRPDRFWPEQWKKWRLKKPILINDGRGRRLATREELKAMKQDKK